MDRKIFLSHMGLMGLSFCLDPKILISSFSKEASDGVKILSPLSNEDIPAYLVRVHGRFDRSEYLKILGACNEWKEGDEIIGVAAANDESRKFARELLSNTKLSFIHSNPVFIDEQWKFILEKTQGKIDYHQLTFGELKSNLLSFSEEEIHLMKSSLTSDHIACVVKLMSNEELIQVSSKVFNSLPHSNIGSKGYMGARVQPNSPTDHPDDIFWQVLNAFSFAVGDVVLGTNPVSSLPESVAALEKTLQDITDTFGISDFLPHCVLSHIDIQAEVENKNPGSTAVLFQSIAGTDRANQTFDVSVEKMKRYARARTGRFGLYVETGQGADETNGHAEGFDLLFHESRKYGFFRSLLEEVKSNSQNQVDVPASFINDVAGFIGPEVFRTKEQLVRCCLEDLVMGKLHGLTIGLDICTTLHMDVSLDDLEWCIDAVMPANPAYLMALPVKNDPMLGYLTTSFVDHVRVRKKFGYKVNDKMWNFFKSIDVIGDDGQPSQNFAQPSWIYFQYLRRKGDQRKLEEIEIEAKEKILQVEKRGVPIAVGYGENFWSLKPALDSKTRNLYFDAKHCLWQDIALKEWERIFKGIGFQTKANNRQEYVYKPYLGEALNAKSEAKLNDFIASLDDKKIYNKEKVVVIVISDGLSALSLSDEGHLSDLLPLMNVALQDNEFYVLPERMIVQYGRVRVGYQMGSLVFPPLLKSNQEGALIHLIGERPGSEHRTFSAYITKATGKEWDIKGYIDHNKTKVVSGISNTSLTPKDAVKEILEVLK